MSARAKRLGGSENWTSETEAISKQRWHCKRSSAGGLDAREHGQAVVQHWLKPPPPYQVIISTSRYSVPTGR